MKFLGNFHAIFTRIDAERLTIQRTRSSSVPLAATAALSGTLEQWTLANIREHWDKFVTYVCQ